jgi:hypothetical protein
VSLALVALTLAALPPAAHAGEADDLQSMIDRARQGVTDLERLDERNAVRDETTVLRMWLEEAWRLRSDQKYDEVRVVLDRCDAQFEMIRQRITSSKQAALAAEKEQAVRRLLERNETLRQAIQKAILEKTALEARSK